MNKETFLNKDWLKSLKLDPEDFYDVMDWLFHKYSIRYTDSREAVINWLYKHYDEDLFNKSQKGKLKEYYYPCIKSKKKKSVWIFYGHSGDEYLCRCSNCGYFKSFDKDEPTKNCPKCGDEMSGVKGD